MPSKTVAPKLDMTPALARDVIDLYAHELTDVRFPDLDLAALEAAQAELHAAQLEVERGEAELAQARALLELRIEGLSKKAERALAYAQVFAQGDAALAPRVAEVGRRKPGAGSEATAALSGPRRGRKPKAEKPELFSSSPALDASERELMEQAAVMQD